MNYSTDKTLWSKQPEQILKKKQFRREAKLRKEIRFLKSLLSVK